MIIGTTEHASQVARRERLSVWWPYARTCHTQVGLNSPRLDERRLIRPRLERDVPNMQDGGHRAEDGLLVRQGDAHAVHGDTGALRGIGQGRRTSAAGQSTLGSRMLAR